MSNDEVVGVSLMLRFKPKAVIGIELTAQAVKLLALSNSKNDIWVEGFAITTLPSGAIVDQQVKNIQSIIDAIKATRKTFANHIKDAVIALPNQCVQSKIIQVKATQLANYVDPGLQDMCWDHALLGASDSPEYVDILIVATPAEHVAVRVDILAEAGFRTKIVDVDHYAAARVEQAQASAKTNLLQTLKCRKRVNQQKLHEYAAELKICCGLALRGITNGI